MRKINKMKIFLKTLTDYICTHIYTHTYKQIIKIWDHVLAFTRMENTFYNPGDGGLPYFRFYKENDQKMIWSGSC